MLSKKYISGFDVRVTRNNWPSEHLLRSDIQTIISVDPMVFPVAPSELVRRSQSGSLLKENIIGLLPDLPPSLHKETNKYKIAVTIDEEVYENLLNKFGMSLTTSEFLKEDDLISGKWIWLGYDVVDLNGLISGLLNCGPLNQKLKDDFAPHINTYSLFGDYSVAKEYANVRSKEIPAHSPFSVAAIWRKPD